MGEECEERVEREIKVEEVKQVSEKGRELAERFRRGLLAELAGVEDVYVELKEIAQEKREQIKQLRESELT